MTDKQGAQHKKQLTRRNVMIAGGAAVAAAGVGSALTASGAFADEPQGAKGAASADSSSSEECYRLTSETTEGPYYLDLDIFRSDITEGKEGIPLVLKLKVVDSDTCKPIPDAAVDIWHCDALGIYSGYESISQDANSGSNASASPTGSPTAMPSFDSSASIHEENTDDKTYLRGTQRTDKHGNVEFRTIVPGWYSGRCVHIHTKVHVDGKWNSDKEYVGGHVCHTGQFFLDQDVIDASDAVAPYSENETTMTTLEGDIIYDQSGTQGGLLDIQYVRKGQIAKGLIGSITMGVDPDETNDNDTMASMNFGSMPSASASAS
ncbi:intradiol ring-cleavage dioxygenase [Streptomyces sp. NPDC003247]|uniref:intradiol ring-cleavage dioxygenase n=1 Tax=Streptomyces sp. NPDC003247 TaxID=3364677 RepID=UPI0036D0B62F